MHTICVCLITFVRCACTGVRISYGIQSCLSFVYAVSMLSVSFFFISIAAPVVCLRYPSPCININVSSVST